MCLIVLAIALEFMEQFCYTQMIWIAFTSYLILHSRLEIGVVDGGATGIVMLGRGLLRLEQNLDCHVDLYNELLAL